VRTKKVAFQVIGGVGGASLRYYETGATGSAIGPRMLPSTLAATITFKCMAACGSVLLTDHVFLRPQFDIHYVPNLTQFGSNLVTSETLWLGYTFGSQ